GQPDVPGEVIVAAIACTHVERAVVGAGDVVTRLPSVPESRVPRELVVHQRGLLQQRPGIEFSLRGTGGLENFEYGVIVKVGQSGIPVPAASRHAERFTGVLKRGDPVTHPVDLVLGAQENETGLVKSEVARDVADEDVVYSVTIQVTEVDT